MRELILEKRSVAQVARRYGKNRSTIYRWKKKWKINKLYFWRTLVGPLNFYTKDNPCHISAGGVIFEQNDDRIMVVVLGRN